MAWVIRKLADGHMVIEEGDEVRGSIKPKGPSSFEVVMHGAPAFKWGALSIDQAIGYVRGVERAAKVHAEETRR